MLINEILDRKPDFKVVKSTENTFATEAKIGKRKIIFVAMRMQDEMFDEEWSVEFTEKKGFFSSNTHEKTGSGNELEVFAMVKASIEEFIKKYKPVTIEFTADKSDGSARADLYFRMIKRFKVPGYTAIRGNQEKQDQFFLTTNKVVKA
jgi:hypothetical protein